MTAKAGLRTGYLLFAALGAFAQQAPFTPAPRVLQIYREQVLLGREGDYLRIETEAVAMESRLHFQHSYLTLQGVNRSGEVWYVNGYDTYAQIDQIGQDVAANRELTTALQQVAVEKADLVLDPHTVFGRFRGDLSYGRGLSGPRTRYFVVSVVSVRPGHGQDYAELRKIIRSAHERANSGEIHSVYQVESGMPDGTFLVFTPAATLEEGGASRQFDQSLDNALDAASRTRLRELSEAAILQSETNILSVNATISLPAKEWVDADPELWKPAAAKPE